jgi:hypothetical protein
MFRNLLLAGAFACASFAVSAAECEYRFDDLIGQFAAAGAPIVEIGEADLPAIVAKAEEMEGVDLGEVTRGFLVNAGGQILLGLEVDGCLLPPILVGLVGPSPTNQLSGKDEKGNVGA